jgi:hypothetical protein
MQTLMQTLMQINRQNTTNNQIKSKNQISSIN